MPTGVYTRTKDVLERARANLAKGHSRASREKANAALRTRAQDPKWRERVSEGTKRAMHEPATRVKHLAGLAAAIEKHGVGFKGGNGQRPVAIVESITPGLEAQGYIREFAIRTAGHGTGLRTPTNYKVDFGNPKTKQAIEFDGPAHRPLRKRALDLKKDTVLKALGWTVTRFKHD
jgi:hypothetical protein